MSIFLCLILLVLTSCTYIDNEIAKEILPEEIVAPVTVSYDKTLGTTYNIFYERNITPKSFEPTQGILLGAYILASKNIDYDITTFETRVDLSHNQYVYNYTLGTKFDNSFILKCIARGKTPYIVVNPDMSDRYNLSYVEKFSKDVGFFTTDVFIELYPSPSTSNFASDDYKLFFENAYNIFNKNIKNFSIVFTPNMEELSDMDKFYTGLKYVDWIGYKYVGSINPNNENIYPDFFSKLDYIYKTYEETHPIIVSMYTLSHYSKVNHKYYDTEFKEEISSVYNKISKEYPRIKAINYFDINGTLIGKKYANDNYSISEDFTIAKNYSSIVDENLTPATTDSAIKTQLIKTYNTAYKFEDNIYFSQNTLEKIFGISDIIIRGYDHVFVDEEKFYSSTDLLKMDSTINIHVNEVDKQIIIK